MNNAEQYRAAALAASISSQAQIKRENALYDAAPAMLEALRDIYNDLKQGAIPNHDDEWWERARAAIARATGEPQ
jgi:hypothetical protein